MIYVFIRGHSKSTFAQRGGGGGGGLTKSEHKRTWGGGGGGAFTIAYAYVRFSKIVWPILFTLAIVIELFSSLLHFLFLLVSSCFFLFGGLLL